MCITNYICKTSSWDTPGGKQCWTKDVTQTAVMDVLQGGLATLTAWSISQGFAARFVVSSYKPPLTITMEHYNLWTQVKCYKQRKSAEKRQKTEVNHWHETTTDTNLCVMILYGFKTCLQVISFWLHSNLKNKPVQYLSQEQHCYMTISTEHNTQLWRDWPPLTCQLSFPPSVLSCWPHLHSSPLT
jgi:hypothetical protein